MSAFILLFFEPLKCFRTLLIVGTSKMGDFLLTHNEEGRAYFERMIYLCILLYVIGAIASIVWAFDIIVVATIGCIITVSIILYILHYLYKNPPREFDAGPSPILE
jgi:hypothetical protein